MTDESAATRHLTVRRLSLLGVLIIVATIVFLLFRERLSLQGIAEEEARWREFHAAYPWLVYAVAFLAYVLITGLSLPFATALTLSYAWFFGMAPALLLVSFASTAGATIAFLISRYVLREAFQSKFGERLGGFNEALDREGAFYLFSLRLIPPIPFFIINAVMGLTKIKVTTFWWVSQLGMLPGTIVYVYAGSSVPSLKDLAEHGPRVPWQLILAFALIGLLPLVFKKSLELIRRKGFH